MKISYMIQSKVFMNLYSMLLGTLYDSPLFLSGEPDLELKTLSGQLVLGLTTSICSIVKQVCETLLAGSR